MAQATITHGDITLPILPPYPDTVALLELDREKIDQSDFLQQERFTRYVRISLAVRGSLRSLIETADEVFTAAARAVDAELVDYEWGLAKTPAIRAALEYMHPDLPKGYSLAADVATVPNAQALSESQKEHIDRILGPRLFTIETDSGACNWHDSSSTQFILGPNGPVLTDIELMFSPVSLKKDYKY